MDNDIRNSVLALARVVVWTSTMFLALTVLLLAGRLTGCIRSRRPSGSRVDTSSLMSPTSLLTRLPLLDHGLGDGHMQKGLLVSLPWMASILDGLESPSDAKGPDGAFLCPITQEVFIDPVVAADGFSYERRALSLWRKLTPRSDSRLPRLVRLVRTSSLLARHCTPSSPRPLVYQPLPATTPPYVSCRSLLQMQSSTYHL